MRMCLPAVRSCHLTEIARGNVCAGGRERANSQWHRRSCSSGGCSQGAAIARAQAEGRRAQEGGGCDGLRSRAIPHTAPQRRSQRLRVLSAAAVAPGIGSRTALPASWSNIGDGLPNAVTGQQRLRRSQPQRQQQQHWSLLACVWRGRVVPSRLSATSAGRIMSRHSCFELRTAQLRRHSGSGMAFFELQTFVFAAMRFAAFACRTQHAACTFSVCQGRDVGLP